MEGKVARITVGGVLLRGDRVLLGKRSADRTFYPGAWDVPGGHCGEEETPEQTLVRELEEELGIVPVEYRLLAVLQEPNPVVHGEGSHRIYLVTKWNGAPRNLREDEHSELAWVRLDEVDRLEPAVPSVIIALRSIRGVTHDPSINPEDRGTRSRQ